MSLAFLIPIMAAAAAPSPPVSPLITRHFFIGPSPLTNWWNAGNQDFGPASPNRVVAAVAGQGVASGGGSVSNPALAGTSLVWRNNTPAGRNLRMALASDVVPTGTNAVATGIGGNVGYNSAAFYSLTGLTTLTPGATAVASPTSGNVTSASIQATAGGVVIAGALGNSPVTGWVGINEDFHWGPDPLGRYWSVGSAPIVTTGARTVTATFRDALTTPDGAVMCAMAFR